MHDDTDFTVWVADYGMGNIASVANMLKRIGVGCAVATTAEELKKARKVILPGVGSFDEGMRNLESRGFVQVLQDTVLTGRASLLGICLGAQLLGRRSDEGSLAGLGWIAGETVAFDCARMSREDRLPHMGWADVDFRRDSRLAFDVGTAPRYYFVHSYHLRCDDPADELCHAVHGYRFVAGVERGNIVGVQFHPEKSHRFGMQILRNFVERY